MHWVSWERLCEAKEVGGMGFKDIEQFNNALLAKQVWRMMNNPDSLCFRVFKVRFFPNCSILDVEEKASGSYAWKSILSARDVIRKGMVWRIGNGQSVRLRRINGFQLGLVASLFHCCLMRYLTLWLVV